MRIGQLLTNMGQQPGGHGQAISDAAARTTCEKCGTPQTMAEATVREQGDDTEYICCKEGCGQIVAAVRSQSGTTYYQLVVKAGGLTVDWVPADH
jgi:hypothetical protein